MLIAFSGLLFYKSIKTLNFFCLNNSTNPPLKSASILLEIQIIVTFYHKNQLKMNNRIIKHII